METIRLLKEDVDLASGIAPSEHAVACANLHARVVTVEPGPWGLEGFMTSEPGHLGLLVLEGLVMRTVEVCGRSWVDLLDRGNILRPWDPLDDHAGLLDVNSSWTVVLSTRLAVLDCRFAAAAARWPVLMEGLLNRSLRHSRWLATLLAINSRPRVEDRLLLLFRHLAARFGRVTPGGVVVDLPVTHELLSQMVAAQRQSVSAALSALAKQGELRRVEGRGWYLRAHAAVPADR